MTTTLINSYALQYTAVAIILLGCLVWLVLSVRKRFRSRRDTPCAGCGLAAACNKPRVPKSADCSAQHASPKEGESVR